MIFTRATGYTILALVELSKTDKTIGTELLSEKIGVSKYFLAKLLQTMARNGIVNSYKGVNGGFLLNLKPNEIKIIDIFKSVEDKDTIVYVCSKIEDDCPRGEASICSIWPFLNMLEDDMFEYLSKYTLEDVIKAKN